MFPINKIYLNLDFVFTFKTHPKRECYQLVQLCFLCKNISILFLLEILHNSHKKYFGLFVLGRLCFSTHRGMCKMSIKDEINFPIVSYPFVCINIPVVPPYGYSMFQYRRVCKYQSGGQNPCVGEGRTTQWLKDKKYKRTNNDLQNIHIKLKIE